MSTLVWIGFLVGAYLAWRTAKPGRSRATAESGFKWFLAGIVIGIGRAITGGSGFPRSKRRRPPPSSGGSSGDGW